MTNKVISERERLVREIARLERERDRTQLELDKIDANIAMLRKFLKPRPGKRAAKK